MNSLKKLLLIIFFIHVSLAAAAQSNKANTLVDEGNKLYEADKIEEAVARYKEALELEPKNPYANYKLAYAYISLYKYNEAIECAEDVIKPQNKYSADAGVILGYAYNEQKQFHKAMDRLEGALYLNPKSQRAHYQIAVTHHNLTNDFTAEKHIVEAIRLDPVHKPSYRLYGDICKSSQRPATALLLYCTYLMMDFNTDESLTVLAEVKKILASKRPMEWGVLAEINQKKKEGFAARSGTLTPVDSLAIGLQAAFEVIARPASPLYKVNSIFSSYYGPLYFELTKYNHVEVMAQIISFRVNPDETRKWLTAHGEKYQAYFNWLETLKKYKLQ